MLKRYIKQTKNDVVFRKLLSNLPYSPALIADIGFYANRLRNEEVTRRTTVLFVVLALVMQSLAVFSPPESANASSEQDIIRGGVTDLNDFLARYDRNENDVKDIYSTAGVSRSEIVAVKPATISSRDDTYIMSRYGQLSPAGNEVSMSYQRSAGGMGVRYFSPLAAISGANTTFDGWAGKSATLGWFGILKSNGSLATKGLPTSISPSDASVAGPVKTVSALNLSQDSHPTEKTTAKPLDKLVYTLRLSNPQNISVTGIFDVRIADVLEYSSLIDGGGGSFDSNTGTISWPSVQLAPGESQERTFAVQLLPAFPATAAGQSNPASFDCKLSLVFGNVLTTNVKCPPEKDLENVLSFLPPTDTGANILFSVILLAVVLFFYVRTRQMKKEIKIVRHNYNTGVI
jgi:hypothetical protein